MMRIRGPFLITFVVTLLIASSAGLLPHSVLPSAPESAKSYIPAQSDKVLHFITFFALSASFYFILDTARRRVLHLTLVICTGILGVGSEVVQGLLPNDREFDPWDVLANVIGSLAAIGLCTLYHKRQLERRRRAKYSALTGEGMDDEELELEENNGGTGIPQPRQTPSDLEALTEQETGIVHDTSEIVRPSTKPVVAEDEKRTVEEELDNWDENVADEWDEDEDLGIAGGTTVNDVKASQGISNEGTKKVAVD